MSESTLNADDVDFTRAEEFVKDLRTRLVSRNLSKHPQPPQAPLPVSSYVLHCIQMPRDYTIEHHSRVSVEGTLERMCAWATLQRIPLVVKPHPAGTPHGVQLILDKWRNSPAIHVHDGNIH